MGMGRDTGKSVLAAWRRVLHSPAYDPQLGRSSRTLFCISEMRHEQYGVRQCNGLILVNKSQRLEVLPACLRACLASAMLHKRGADVGPGFPA